MKRRTFIKSVGSGALLTLGPHFAGSADAVSDTTIRILFKAGTSLGHFPNVAGPRILAAGKRGAFTLFNSNTDTLLQNGEQILSLGRLERARLDVSPQGVIYVAGLRDDGLWLVQVDTEFKTKATRLATIPKPHPAAGLDLAYTPDGVRIVAPGPVPRTMALYTNTPEAKSLVLTIHAWSHPLLRYDSVRRRMHVVLCPWNDYSAIYDTVYYLRSDDHGANWLKADGTRHELPLQPTAREHGYERPRPEVISITGQPAGGHSNTLAHCLELDTDGHPHLLYSFSRPYHLAREPFMRCAHVCWDGTKWSLDNWDGAKWKFGELSADHSWDVAGGCLSIFDRMTLRALLMFKDRKVPWLELGIASSKDGGKTWSAIKPLTRDAKIKAAHYVTPQWMYRGNDYAFVCAGFHRAQETPIYEGIIPESLFA